MRLPLPQVEVPARALVPPHPAIEAALAAVSLLPGVKPAHRAALAELVRCVSWHMPAQRFRVSVAHLMERMGRSDATIDRYLSALRTAGWIGREQVTRQARRHGWKPAWTWLTDQALQALGLLQRGSDLVHVPKPPMEGKRFAVRREHRIRHDLRVLLTRLTPAKVVWLMAEAKARGKWLQEVLAGHLDEVLAADCPVGRIRQLLTQRSPALQPQAGGRSGRGDAVDTAAYRQAVDAQRAAAVRGPAARARGDAIRALLGRVALNRKNG